MRIIENICTIFWLNCSITIGAKGKKGFFNEFWMDWSQSIQFMHASWIGLGSIGFSLDEF
jgi:hypothetical protein